MNTKETTNTATKTRYERTIIGFMTSEESFANNKSLGIKVSGEALPYIDSEGNAKTTNVINVSSTQIMQAQTDLEPLIVLQAMVLLNQAVKRSLLNMLLVKGTIVFTRELKPAGYTPLGATEPLERDCYITEIEKVNNNPLPVIINMAMNEIANGNIYEPTTTKAVTAPIIAGVAPQIPE